MKDYEFEGRIYIHEEDPLEIETWVYELEPERGMSKQEWAREVLATCYSEEQLRKKFGLTEYIPGTYQVIFKARMVRSEIEIIDFAVSGPLDLDDTSEGWRDCPQDHDFYK